MKRVLIIVVSLVVLIIIGMVASYAVSIGRLEKLTDEVRRNLPGQFIRLTDGTISYYWKGPADGEIVVLVHGLSTPKFVWDGNVDALADAGYRVLAFDHFGRGYSDRPDTTYDADFYDRELTELLDKLGVQSKVDMVGYSMGGGIATGFTARHPERINKLILIAPAGFVPKYSGLASLVLVPGLGDWLMTMLGKKVMLQSIRREVAGKSARPDMIEKFEKQFKYRGYLPAILSTMRHYPMYDLSADYEAVGRSRIPVWAIWGTKDDIVPFAGTKKVRQAVPQVRILPVEGAGHTVTFARAETVNRLLLGILRE